MSDYFGAYLEIEVRQIRKEIEVMKCPNVCGKSRVVGNKSVWSYCPYCGYLIKPATESLCFYPELTMLDDPQLDKDALADITPFVLRQVKPWIVIVISNYPYYCWDLSDTFLPFPTAGEIDNMKAILESSCKDEIDILKNMDCVKSVEVKAGYVEVR